MIRVLHATISCEPGGRREAIFTLARRQQGLGLRPDLCCLDRLGCDPDLLTGAFDRHLVLERRGVFDRSAIQRLTQFCDEREIDVIHTHDAASQSLAALLRLNRSRIKLLMTFHRSRGIDSAAWSDRFRNMLAALPCGAVVVGSRERRDHFLHENYVPARKVVRIPFGVDIQRFHAGEALRAQTRQMLNVDDATCVFGAVGHFGEEKGIDVVLRGYAELWRRLPAAAKTKLVVLGDGSDDRRRAIETLASSIPSDRLMLAGFRQNVECWFNAMDVFVHAPRQEAFGLVVAEAMATRLPVVATAVGGITDVVADGESGILTRSEDVLGLAEAMYKLWCHREMRELMAGRSEHIARTAFTAELYARRYVDLYHDLLANRQPRGVDDSDAGPHRPTAIAADSAHRANDRPDLEQIVPSEYAFSGRRQ
jgi:glycosyltransferase involved in cell wall biosynthesis